MPAALGVDELGLEKPDLRLRERVVVGVPEGAPSPRGPTDPDLVCVDKVSHVVPAKIENVVDTATPLAPNDRPAQSRALNGRAEFGHSERDGRPLQVGRVPWSETLDAWGIGRRYVVRSRRWWCY